MKYLSLLQSAAVAATLVFTGASYAEELQSLESLYEAAKAEGEVIFGGAIKEEVGQKLLEGFAAKYPGIQVSYVRRSTEPLVQMIEADKLVGKVSFDVLNLTEPADLVRWKEEGYLAAVPVENIDQHRENTYDPDLHYYSLGITPMYGLYNTDQLSAEEAPKSLKELITDDKWVGKIAISRPTRGGTNAISLLNIAKLYGEDAIIGRAKDLDVLLTRGNEAAMTAIVSGERSVSWGISGYRALEAKADGAPIELIYWEEGLPLANFMGAVPEKAPHPNAARLLMRYLLSEEGQDIVITEGNFYSARKDISKAPANEKPLDELHTMIFSPDEVVQNGHALAVKYDEAVGLR